MPPANHRKLTVTVSRNVFQTPVTGRALRSLRRVWSGGGSGSDVSHGRARRHDEVPPVTIAAVSAEDSKQRIADTTHELLLEADGTPDPRRQELLDEVVLLNAPLARSIASRYRSKGVDSDDLEQVAYLGLVKAANGYRPDASTTFLSYAVPTIRGELKRYFRDCAWTVRPPRRVDGRPAPAGAGDAGQHRRRRPRAHPAARARAERLRDCRGAGHGRGRDCRGGIGPWLFQHALAGRAGPDRRRHQPARPGRRRRGRLRPGRERAHAHARGREPGRPGQMDPGTAVLQRPDPGRDRHRARRQPDAGVAPAARDPGEVAVRTGRATRSRRGLIRVASPSWTSRRRRTRSTRLRRPTSLLLAASSPSS